MPYYGDGGYDAGEVGDKIAELLKKPLVSRYRDAPARLEEGVPNRFENQIAVPILPPLKVKP